MAVRLSCTPATALDGDLGPDRRRGDRVAVVRSGLVEPLRWIASNAGEEGYVVVAKVRELPANHGLNAATGEYGDLLAAGVVDPVKVTKAALANAASVASLVLSTQSAIVEKPAERGARPRRSRPRSRPRPLARPGLLSRPLTARTTRTAPRSDPRGRSASGGFTAGAAVDWTVRPIGRSAGVRAGQRSGGLRTSSASRSSTDSPPHTP